MKEFLDHVKESGLRIPHEEHKHLKEVDKTTYGMSTFYCVPKVHKNETHVPLRQVIATINNKLCYLSEWVTAKMKPTTKKLSA